MANTDNLLGHHTPLHTDICIVGGGPVGGFLAHALATTPFSVTLLEAEPTAAAQDPRMLAISTGSQQLLHRLGLWENTLEDAPITSVHVSQQGHFGRTLLGAHDIDTKALGYVVPYAQLQATLRRHAAPSTHVLPARATAITQHTSGVSIDYTHTNGTHGHLTARLLVLADGGKLAPTLGFEMISQDYAQSALLAQIQAEHMPVGRAFERFTAQGALALLPRPGGYALVWSQAHARTEALLSLPDAALLQALQAAVGHKAGQFTGVLSRHALPLSLRYAKHIVRERVALLGNAAQSLHPIAGQGLNLGLRDAWALARCLHDANPHVLHDPHALLRHYAAERRLDKLNGIGFTDSLLTLFATPGLGHARGAGLAWLDNAQPLKRSLLRHMAFGVRR